MTKKRNAARKAQQLVKKGQTGGAPSCLGPSPWEACSCLHPTTTTITVTPSVALTTTLTTITSTATLTSTETVQGPFNIMGVEGTKTQGFPIASSAPDFAVGTTPQSGGGFPFVSYDSTSADAFYLTSNGTLLDSTFTDANGNPYIAFQYTDFSTPEGGNAPVTIAPGSTVYSSGGYQPLVCFLDPNNCRLDCRANGNENNFQCYYNYLNEWYIAPSPVSPSQCYVFSVSDYLFIPPSFSTQSAELFEQACTNSPRLASNHIWGGRVVEPCHH